MTTTDTAAPIGTLRRELTQAEFHAEGTALFGLDYRAWAFRCPICGSVATPADFPKGSGDRAPVECLGRYGVPDRCKYAAYGFIPSPWSVVQEDGSVVFCFPFAAPSQAPRSAAQDPAATPGPESPAGAPDAAVGPGRGNGAATVEAPGAYWTVEHGWTDEPRIDCSCHITAPCHRCEALVTCGDCPSEVQVLDYEMDAHKAECHPEPLPLPSAPYLTSDDGAEAEA